MNDFSSKVFRAQANRRGDLHSNIPKSLQWPAFQRIIHSFEQRFSNPLSDVVKKFFDEEDLDTE